MPEIIKAHQSLVLQLPQQAKTLLPDVDTQAHPEQLVHCSKVGSGPDSQCVPIHVSGIDDSTVDALTTDPSTLLVLSLIGGVWFLGEP